MSKPDDVPQDVWGIASELSDLAYLDFSPVTGAVAIARAILAAKAEERQVFVDMIEQFGSAKLIRHCRAAIKRGEA